MLEKPSTIANDSFKSQKWDEIVSGRKFTSAQIPVLTMLVQWYAVLQRCIDDLDDSGGMVAYSNEMGDFKPLPQIGVMKQASAEIRAINKQLGINDEVSAETEQKTSGVMKLVTTSRAQRRANAAG